MNVDWFTVGAQLLNFVVLVFLLNRFLFKPILAAIDAREQRINAELADADAKKVEAVTERATFQHKNEELDQQRATLLTRATDDANTERVRLVAQARVDADTAALKRQEALRRELADLSDSMAQRAQHEVFAIARRTLGDLASVDLEALAAAEFIRRLEVLTEPARAALARPGAKSPEPALIRSAFDLPEAERTAIRAALANVFVVEVEVRFETAPELVSGIELVANGQKLAWNIAAYLTTLEERVATLLGAPTNLAKNP